MMNNIEENMFEENNDVKSGFEERPLSLFMGNNDNNTGVIMPNVSDDALNAKDDVFLKKDDGFSVLTNPDEVISDADLPLSQHQKFEFIESDERIGQPVVTPEIIGGENVSDVSKALGNWARQALDVENYSNAIESMGAEIARYKVAYDEGKMGEFDLKKIGKETLKAFGRGVASDTLRSSGNILSMMGANLKGRGENYKVFSDFENQLADGVGDVLSQIGFSLKNYANKAENLEILASSPELYDANPNWVKLSNVVGRGSSQVLAMGILSKILGAKAAYGIFAGGGGAEIFSESYEKDKNLSKANALALLSGGTTYVIDKIFNPLPKQMQKGVETTSQLIAKEAVGAPLREAGSEVLQQLMSENMVRVAGIDAGADLFEGLIESALGAIAGSGSLVLANGGFYYADKKYHDVKDALILRGVTKEDISLFEENAVALLQSKPEAFEKILHYNMEHNLRSMNTEAKLLADKKMRTEKKQDVKLLKKVYDKMYQKSKETLNDKEQAKLAARFMQSMFMFMKEVDKDFSISKALLKGLPDIQQMSYNEFFKSNSPEQAVSYMVIGPRAKKADLEVYKEVSESDNSNYKTSKELQKATGWFMGSDHKLRSLISDKDAYVKLWDKKLDTNAQYDTTEVIAEQENGLMYLGRMIDSYANEGAAYYIKDFYDFLQDNDLALDWVKKDEQNILFQHNDEFPESKIWNEREKARDKLLEAYRQYDVSGEYSSDSALEVMKLHEYDDFEKFKEHYWTENKGSNADFKALLKDTDVLILNNPQFKSDLAQIRGNAQTQMRELEKVGAEYQIKDMKDLKLKLKQNEAYSIYKLLNEYKFKLARGELDGKTTMAKWNKRDIAFDNNALYRQNLGFEDLFSEELPADYFLQKAEFRDLPLSERMQLQEVLKLVAQYFYLERRLDFLRKGMGNIHADAAMETVNNLSKTENVFETSDFMNEDNPFDLYNHDVYSDFLYSDSKDNGQRKISMNQLKAMLLNDNQDLSFDALLNNESMNSYFEYQMSDNDKPIFNDKYRDNQNIMENRYNGVVDPREVKLREHVYNGAQFKLGDLLEHTKLYENYPDIQDVEVNFKPLDSVEGYHFYRKNNSWPVLEIDARKINADVLLDVLLRGAMFSAQTIEGFDPALNSLQRDKLAHQLYYDAKAELSNKLYGAIEEFMGNYLSELNLDDYASFKTVDVEASGLYDPENVAKAKKRQVRYLDVDFEGLVEAVDHIYSDVSTDVKKEMRQVVLGRLKQIRENYSRSLNLFINIDSGLENHIFPWSGLNTQGKVDEMRMLQDFYGLGDEIDNVELDTKEERRRRIMRELNEEILADKLAREKELAENFDLEIEYNDEVDDDLQHTEPAKPLSETDKIIDSIVKDLLETFEKNRAEKKMRGDDVQTPPEVEYLPLEKVYNGKDYMQRNFELSQMNRNIQSEQKKLISEVVAGAYEYGKQMISLFEEATPETLLHEMFHHFSLLMRDPELRDNLVVRQNFTDVMEDYKKMFFDKYQIQYSDGYFFAQKRTTSDNHDDGDIFPQYYRDITELFNRGAEEMFVEDFMQNISKRSKNKTYDGYGKLAAFYGQWMRSMMKALQIKKDKLGQGGATVMELIDNFLGKKVSKKGK